MISSTQYVNHADNYLLTVPAPEPLNNSTLWCWYKEPHYFKCNVIASAAGGKVVSSARSRLAQIRAFILPAFEPDRLRQAAQTQRRLVLSNLIFLSPTASDRAVHLCMGPRSWGVRGWERDMTWEKGSGGAEWSGDLFGHGISKPLSCARDVL